MQKMEKLVQVVVDRRSSQQDVMTDALLAQSFPKKTFLASFEPLTFVNNQSFPSLSPLEEGRMPVNALVRSENDVCSQLLFRI